MNSTVVHATDNETTWGIVASDGTTHTTLANLASAGKVAWPNLDAGMHLHTLILRSENASGADGATFYVALNQGTAFTGLANDAARDNVGMLVSGAGQTLTINGVDGENINLIHNVWIRKLTGGDEIIVTGLY